MDMSMSMGLRGAPSIREGVGGPIVALGADLALWFDTNQAYKSSGGGVVTPASILTVARASAGWYFDSAGVLQQAANNALRLDYNPVTLAPLGVLIEEQRTNLLLNSTTLSTQSVTVTAVAHTLSFYGTGTVTLTGVSTAGPLVGTGASQKVSLTFTPTAGTLTLTTSGTVSFANLEIGAFGTSPIITAGSQVTRAADDISILTSAFPYSATAGTVAAVFDFYNYVAGAGGSGGIVGIGGSSPRIRLDVRALASRPIGSQIYDGTTVGGSIGPNLSDLAVNTFHNAAFGWDAALAGTSYMTWNGLSSSQGSGNSAAINLSGASPMRIGRRPDEVVFLNGHIKRLAYYASRKTNAQLEALST